MRGMQAIERVVEYSDVDTVLDIGSWNGEHASYLKMHGKNVSTVDFNVKADYHGDYLELDLPQFDCIWCSHVLEHVLDVHSFLVMLRKLCKRNGILAITVPPTKNALVGGHVSLWTSGLLLYRLVLAGWDCHQAQAKKYGYNISVIVRRKVIRRLPGLHYDSGDIKRLLKYLPAKMREGMNGQEIERWEA